jgi:hypothetical protein
LRKQVVSRERAKRGKVIDSLIRSKVECYRAELKEQQEELCVQENWYSRPGCLFDRKMSYRPKALPEGPSVSLLCIRVSCRDGEVIQVVSRGGTKEDDFLTALTDLIREYGWKMELTRVGAEARE